MTDIGRYGLSGLFMLRPNLPPDIYWHYDLLPIKVYKMIFRQI